MDSQKRMFFRNCNLRKKLVFGAILGTSLAVLGAVLIPIADYIVKKEVEKNLVIKPGTQLYDLWRNIPLPIYMQIYMFDLTNPAEVKQGRQPYLIQKGPYTYQEKRIKFNVIHNSNGTVSYRQKRVFTFIREMSVGNESDEFLTVDPAFNTLLWNLQYESASVKGLINAAMEALGYDIFKKRSMKELVWGYHDKLLAMAHMIFPKWFYTDYIGFFINKNNTDDGVYTVYTGETDINKVGLIDKYNGSRYLHFWTTKGANMVNGSDGTMTAPYVSKSDIVLSFVSDVCRTLAGQYSQPVYSPQNIKLYRFVGAQSCLQNATENPNNKGYCTPQTQCLGSGVLNVSTCQLIDSFHIPGIVSLPHFYLADPKYINGVCCMNPNAEEHQTSVDIEPYTGLTLQAKKRVQINMPLKTFPGFKKTENITDVVFPVFWLNESAVIDDKDANKLKSMLFTPLKIISGVEGVLIGGGCLILLLTVVYGLCKWNKELQSDFSEGSQAEDAKEDSILRKHLNGTYGSTNECQTTEGISNDTPIKEDS